ncbi:hypothetical protein LHL20_20300 [Alteromonas sp. McT4-15]|uniref:hypothetical protein n=1 Tax=Alteromonas sp. McT4-15 TaxID=2881256 RepID=UPI001CF8D835|nr:hypothetical protein [Alteromonas sp. McT4-15]MCB4438570.1 hypothetical protein [Alteromonas sp. McT4-15]
MAVTHMAYQTMLRQINLQDIYIQQAFEFYRDRYCNNDEIQRFVSTSSAIPDELRDHAFIGLCDRALGLEIPSARTIEGGAIRGHYQHCGLFVPSGGELFRGCVVFPEFDDNTGQFVSAVGYRFGRVREWQKPVVHWTKPQPDQLVMDGLNTVRKMVHAKAYH